MTNITNPTPLQRRNLTLYASSNKIMAELRSKLEAASDSEVVRYALRYLNQLLMDQKSGRTLYIQPLNEEEYVVSYQSLQKRIDESRDVKKRNIKMNQAAINRIEKMKRIVGVSSDSEIVRRALRYFWLVVTEADRGSNFILTGNGKEIYVRMDILTSTIADNDSTNITTNFTRHSQVPVPAII